MSEMGPWDGTKERLLRIQTRLNEYLAFALDGELSRRFPEDVGKKVHIRIDCDHVPDDVSSAFLERARKVAELNGVSLSIELLRQLGEA
ncbi:hypothetical protein LVJ94_12340 [Pendulispora rubella]|uniref:Uncharacterized protein n=2 Tax=Pendulispora rubella TaxID=2741070 RepID=A0ABZ2LAR8_9BACT